MITTRRAFLQQIGMGAAGFLLHQSLGRSPFAFAADAAGVVRGPGPLPRATPESQGISSGAIQAFLDAIAGSKHEFHSFMLVRHGNVIAEGWWAPYAAELNHTMYSMSKSFTSTAVGFAVSEGMLSVDDPVTKFFPEDLPPTVDDKLAALKVKHLLSMATGHDKDSTGPMVAEENWPKKFLSHPIVYEPGTRFLYDSGATYMCSAIVTKLTGKTVLDYLRPRLFEPLGIEGMTWQTCPRGNNTGGWGLNIRTEGLAKFGQCYLQKGQWNGRQIVPAKWVEEATTKKIQQPLPTTKPARPVETNDWLQGYCYQFWRCTHNAYRGDGAMGQFTIVMPEQDAVLAITSESGSMQGQLDLVWEHLLPAMKAAPLTEDKPAAEKLKQSLASLAIPPSKKGTATSRWAAAVSGKTFKLEPNAFNAEKLKLTFTDEGCTFALFDTAEHSIVCGAQKWALGETDMPGTPPGLGLGKTKNPTPMSKVAASGTWTDAGTYEMTWRFRETPHHDVVTCKFDADKVAVTFLSSVVKLSPARVVKRPELVGTRI
jgi:CubicO group peptidase (beta-lactamase class C family)